MFFKLWPLFCISSKLPFDTSDGNCQWTSLFLMTNSVACISVGSFVEILLSTSNSSKSSLYELCKMLLVTLHHLLSTYRSLWFCHDTVFLNSSPVMNFILPSVSYSATSNSCTSYLVFLHHCLVCRMCQITITATWWFTCFNISRLEHQILIVQRFSSFKLEFQEMWLSRFLNSRIIDNVSFPFLRVRS